MNEEKPVSNFFACGDKTARESVRFSIDCHPRQDWLRLLGPLNRKNEILKKLVMMIVG